MNDYEEIKRERDALREKIERIQRNGQLNMYLAIQMQIDSFTEQLTIRTEINPKKGKGENIEVFGYIDLFADKDSKEFDRAKWVFENYLKLITSQRDLYKLLTEEEKKEVDGKKTQDIPPDTDWDAVRIGMQKKLKEKELKDGTGKKKHPTNDRD